MAASIAIGIDIGGTNLKAAVVDRSGRVLNKTLHAIAGLEPERVLNDIASLVERSLSEMAIDRSTVVGVGVGAPGPLSHRTGRIIHAGNLPGWVDVPVRDFLQHKLRLPVLLENDGNAAAYGEFWAGAGSRDDLVMLTLGTGVGAGVVLDGRILHGHFENAAELGHMIVAVDGLLCACGQRGCLEQYVSASAVARRVVAAIRNGAASALSDAVRQKVVVDAEAVARYAQAGDVLCRTVWDEACRYLAVACVNVQHAFNPARIVLGGGLAEAGAILLDPVTDYAKAMRWTLHDDAPTIALAQLGYDAGVIGAAALVWTQPS